MNSVYRWSFCLVLTMGASSVSAQQTAIDSLQRELKKNISDQEKVDVYVDLAGEFEDSDSALLYAQKAYQLSRSVKYEKGLIWGLFKAGEEYLIMNEIELADSTFNTLLNKAQEANSTEGMGLGYYGLASVNFSKTQTEASISKVDSALYFLQGTENKGLEAGLYEMQGKNYLRLGNYETSMQYVQQANEAYLDLQDQSGLSDTYNLMGIIYDEQGDQSKGLEYFLMATGGNLDQAPIPVINNIANIFQDMANFDTAIYFHKKIIELSREHGSIRNEIVSCLNLGFIYHDLELPEQALEYHLYALSLLEEFDDPLWKGRANNDTGLSYSLLKKFDKAIQHFERAIIIMTEVEDYVGLVEAYHNIAKCHRDRKDYPKAREAAIQTMKIAENIGYPRGTLIGSAVLSEVESATGHYKDAYEAQMIHEEMFDSLLNDEQTQEIARLQAEFNFQKERDSVAFAQQQAKLLFDQELERKQTALVGSLAGGALIFVILGLLYRSFRIKQRNNHELRTRNEIIELKNNELTTKNTEINQLRETEKQLAEESLAMKERELTTITMLSHEKNSMLQQLGDHINTLSRKVDNRVIPDLEEIKKIIKSNLSEESWSTFMMQFERVHPRFFEQLKEKWPKLTQYDLRLCAHIKVGMDNKEIAQVSAISPESVKKSMNRLKKKLELTAEDDLRTFLINL